jgi:hypothetical protein
MVNPVSWSCTPVYTENFQNNLHTENFQNNCPTNPNPTALVYNNGGPAWCQWVVKQSMIPSSIVMNQIYTIAGSPNFNITPYCNSTSPSGNVYNSNDVYKSNETYQLGVVINFNGQNYMNVTWNESIGPITSNNRGAAYSGSYTASPDQDKNAWMPVTIKGILPAKNSNAPIKVPSNNTISPIVPPPVVPPPVVPPPVVPPPVVPPPVVPPPVVPPPVVPSPVVPPPPPPVNTPTSVAPSPSTSTETEWIPGISNTNLIIGAVVGLVVIFLLILLMSE